MGQNKQLTVFERGKIIGFYQAGDPERTISEKTGHSRQLFIIQYPNTVKQVLLILHLEVEGQRNLTNVISGI